MAKQQNADHHADAAEIIELHQCENDTDYPAKAGADIGNEGQHTRDHADRRTILQADQSQAQAIDKTERQAYQRLPAHETGKRRIDLGRAVL